MPGKQDKSEPEKEVLDLIGGKPKKSAKQETASSSAPSATQPSSKAEKKDALDLLSGSK